MDRPLDELIASVRAHAGVVVNQTVGDTSVIVSTVELDSRRCRPGTLFCCVRGANSDGHQFAAAAIHAGAIALLVDHRLDVDVPQVVVDDVRRVVGFFAAAAHDHPASSLTMIGITGTNGKTTVACVLGEVLRSIGRDVRVLGTLSGARTTPESTELQAQLAAWRDDGADCVVMEVSSHALALHRVNGCVFDVAVFTNLSQDHLDLHGDMEQYFAAKASLFTSDLSRHAVVNRDDPSGRRLIAQLSAAELPFAAYSIDDVDGLEVGAGRHAYRWGETTVEVPLGGRFNVSNSLAVANACAVLGVDRAAIADGLRAVAAVPGRLERIDGGQQFEVVVDYAHTPDGLREVLTSMREVLAGRSEHGKLRVVFGCGGDRDRDKRPHMGEVAATLADDVLVTSDNPRTESPESIINAVLSGVPANYGGAVAAEPDRRRAILMALERAGSGDIVVIAGKGHETTQTVGDTVIEFDDRTVARTLLKEIMDKRHSTGRGAAAHQRDGIS